MKRIRLKNIVSLVLTVAIIAGALSLLSSIGSSDRTRIQPYEFSRGMLDDNGEFVDSDTSIYTKELFSCKGLEIEIDFEASVKCQVFYYGEENVFLGKTGEFSKGTYVLDEEILELDYGSDIRFARVVIIPTLEDDDTKIDLWEVYGHANKVKVTVSKNQKFKDVTEETEIVEEAEAAIEEATEAVE